MNRKKRYKLHKLYSKIPKIKCKGLCKSESTTIGLFPTEFVQLTRLTGKEPKLDLQTERCNYLTKEGRCEVYDDRPYVCRAWGVEENMVCYYGCKPDRVLSQAEGFQILKEIGNLLGEKEIRFTATPEDLKRIFEKEGINSSEAEYLANRLTGQI